ncbi:phosphate ABC transporter substrate-binding protein [Saccharibacillus sp. CPCC 101409]|uniref:phosphate ABC transporter substrate-binding protein n=1 Tax=Saccharibacillus sp. CPCC 101409 TaxID=3058041 RepID=UPI0026721864|nr:phosphate ABC transporter substrate-binding protein [Saccharibacillus sp. CPCC 101409]MDO3412275.1 phosphate ABC transporter substrate-binding protein [Saccharibacillus sp. CPCC 101409]
MKSKKTLFGALTLSAMLALTACGNSGSTAAPADNGTTGSGGTGTTTEQPAAETVSGTILAVGSTALQPLVDQVGQEFMTNNGDVTVQVQGGGSGTGLTQVSEGAANIGNSDVFAEEKLDADKAKELVDHQVAVVAMATVVNKDAGVTDLSKEQLLDVFSGKVTNWKDVGGADQKITIVNRPSSSGTRATFEKYALGQSVENVEGAIEQDSSGTVKQIVADTKGAVGYLAFSYLDDTVTALSYGGVEPTEENVQSGKYPIWAYEHMYTKGEPEGAVKAFLDYMMTEEVQNADVTELGYIPVSSMEVKRDAEGKVIQ